MALEAAAVQIQQTRIFENSISEPLCSLKCSPLNDVCLSKASKGTLYPIPMDIRLDDKRQPSIQPGSTQSDTKSAANMSSIQMHSGAKKSARNVLKKKSRKNDKATRKPAREDITECKLGINSGGTVDLKSISCVNISEQGASNSVSSKHQEVPSLDTKTSSGDGSFSHCISNEKCLLSGRSYRVGELNHGETPTTSHDQSAGCCHSQTSNSNEADMKEIYHSKWKKRRRGFGRSRTYKEKNANDDPGNNDASLLRPNACSKPHPFVGCQSSTTSLKSCSDLSDIAPGPESCSGDCSDLVEHSQWTSHSSQTDTGSEQMYSSQVITMPSLRRKRNSSRKRKVQGHSIALHRPQNDVSIPSQKEHPQQKVSHASNFRGKGIPFSTAVHPSIWTKIPDVKSAENVSVPTPADNKQSISSLVDFKVPRKLLPYNKSLSNQNRTCSKKWIPVSRKQANIMEITSSHNIEDECINKSELVNKHEDCSQIESRIPSLSISTSSNVQAAISVTEVSSNSESINSEFHGELVLCIDDSIIQTNIREIHGVANKQLRVESPISEAAFNSSYRLQLVSEFLHKAIGHPVAEFERLLYFATPTIDSSLMCPPCYLVSDDQQCGLSRHLTPSISLGTIWKWYEEVGNYGLKVSFEDSQDQNDSLSDRAVFHAHFVPLLSAVQLFGHDHRSASFAENSKQPDSYRIGAPLPLSSVVSLVLTSSPEESIARCLEDVKVKSKENYRAFEEPHDFSQTPENHGCARLPSLWGDAEILFEFFESEPPHLRMPLYNKVMELSNSGVPNNKAFGDPSILQSTKLSTLHPSSWFSVAWYPIYRIPEGKLRAAFLTYHSLGYVAHASVPTDNSQVKDKSSSSVSFPVIGLQSYNAQEKIWFSSNVDVSTKHKDSAALVVRERRRALEQNASAFARGVVKKDSINIANRHPDFEYFMSHRY